MPARIIKIEDSRRKLQFKSTNELLAYRSEIHAIRNKYGDTLKAKRLAQLLEAKYRSSQINSLVDRNVNSNYSSSVISFLLPSQNVKQGDESISISFNRKHAKPAVASGKNLDMFKINKMKHRVRRMLANLVTSDEVNRWMSAPNAQLNNRTPSEVIEKGQAKEVISLIRRIEEGIYV